MTPEARDALLFYAEIAVFHGDVRDLERLARRCGPEALRKAPADLEAAKSAYLSGEDTASPAALYARVMLSLDPPGAPQSKNLARCPDCGQPPQCGVVRPEADGSGLWLACSLCRGEWRFPRGRCAGCHERDETQVGLYASGRGLTQTCDACWRYLHWVDCAKDAESVPEVDEIAALAVDYWMREQGYAKVHPNWVGI